MTFLMEACHGMRLPVLPLKAVNGMGKMGAITGKHPLTLPL